MHEIVSQASILVTGGGGFIGSALVRRLVNKNAKVHLLWKKTSSKERLLDIENKIKFYEVELDDRKNLETIIKKVKPQAIFHLAVHSNYRNQEDIEKMFEISVKGTMNLLIASKDIQYDIFVNTGSSSEYGFKRNPMREKDLLEPISFYAAAKASSTLLCQAFSYYFNKPVVTVRPFSVFGPFENNSRFIPTVIRSIINSESIQLTPGNQRRDFIYVEDVVDAYLQTIVGGQKIKGKVFNLGTGSEYSNDEIVKKLFRISNIKVPIEKGGYKSRMWDSPHWVADISYSKKYLKWNSITSIDDGLKKTYMWYKAKSYE